jgi:hypothetical protein
MANVVITAVMEGAVGTKNVSGQGSDTTKNVMTRMGMRGDGGRRCRRMSIPIVRWESADSIRVMVAAGRVWKGEAAADGVVIVIL